MKTGLSFLNTSMSSSIGVSLLLALGGCAGSDSQDPFELEATEIEQIASALEEDADGALDDVAADGELAAADADGGQARGHRGRHGRGPQRGDRRGRGVGPRDLVLWYGDLTALQACRDERDACIASGATTCNESARECVRGLLEDAFTAMCDERVAACEAEGTTNGACGRIVDRCAAGLPGPRDGGFGDRDGGGHRGHDGRGEHDGRNCDGGDPDDDEEEGDDEPGPTDAGVPSP